MFMTQPILSNSMYTIFDEVEEPSINKMGGLSILFGQLFFTDLGFHSTR